MFGLFTYLLHAMRDGQQFTLAYMLNHIVAKMFGWHDIVIS